MSAASVGGSPKASYLRTQLAQQQQRGRHLQRLQAVCSCPQLVGGQRLLSTYDDLHLRAHLLTRPSTLTSSEGTVPHTSDRAVTVTRYGGTHSMPALEHATGRRLWTMTECSAPQAHRQCACDLGTPIKDVCHPLMWISSPYLDCYQLPLKKYCRSSVRHHTQAQ